MFKPLIPRNALDSGCSAGFTQRPEVNMMGVFSGIEIAIWDFLGKVLADTSDRCAEDQQIIDKILSHLKKKDRLPSLPDALPETRASPHTIRFRG